MTDRDSLTDLAIRAQRAGVCLGVHANGDRAIQLLLDAFESAVRQVPSPQLRHRIEHCSVVTSEILARMKALGVVAVPFGSYVNYHGSKLLDWYGEDRLERMFAHRWFLDAGIPVAGSSDYPCAPFEPLLGIQSCVTRRSSDGQLLGPSQRVSVQEALGFYTTGAAFATGEEHMKGRIAPGYLADFVALAEHPDSCAEEEISQIPVLGTWVGGELVHRTAALDISENAIT